MPQSYLNATQETVDEVFSALEARGLINLQRVGQDTIDRFELVYQISKEIAYALPAKQELKNKPH